MGGGVMVLVIYIRTLSANEKVISIKIAHSYLVIPLFYVLRLFLFFDFYIISKPGNMGCYVSHIYSYSNSTLTIFLIGYLLLTMVRVVKLVKFEKGPLVARL